VAKERFFLPHQSNLPHQSITSILKSSHVAYCN
jgi:hypothetical protein